MKQNDLGSNFSDDLQAQNSFTFLSNSSQKKKKLKAIFHMIHIGASKLVMGTISDLSNMIAYQKEKNLSAMKTIAFDSAAHEFRNPLNAIIQSTHLLEDSVDMQKGGRFYEVVLNCSKLMLSLVNDILDSS